ncbi:MAG: hypothetical protein QOC77_1384 [Thermoleophilaceae bacterium]|nr:hypothetical protein [Thermoleophilaceae bacterium]MEA2469717.1 hypothetical protein [Thermoleophilaceae bacterium]
MPGSGDGTTTFGSEFQYALLRVVPRLERGEQINAGVVLFARRSQFLAALVRLDEERLRALAPEVDAAPLTRQLEALARVAAGEPSAGPIASLPQSERFAWIVAPSSTAIQPSAVHVGLCDDPQAELERLFDELVR